MRFTEKQIYKMFQLLQETTTKASFSAYSIAGMSCNEREKLIREIENQQFNRMVDLGGIEDISFPQFPESK